jgi:hypothetical protein
MEFDQDRIRSGILVQETNAKRQQFQVNFAIYGPNPFSRLRAKLFRELHRQGGIIFV